MESLPDIWSLRRHPAEPVPLRSAPPASVTAAECLPVERDGHHTRVNHSCCTQCTKNTIPPPYRCLCYAIMLLWASPLPQIKFQMSGVQKKVSCYSNRSVLFYETMRLHCQCAMGNTVCIVIVGSVQWLGGESKT